jgi:hypothetical protein
MFGGNLMPCTHDATLEKRESGFNCVRVNVAYDVQARTVANRLVVPNSELPLDLGPFERRTLNYTALDYSSRTEL